MNTIDYIYRFDPTNPSAKPLPNDADNARRTQEVGMIRGSSEMPKQSPFGVVVGCSDARVPTEMLFGQGFNDLFVIRVAGNVLGDVCMGSVDFALNALSDSVRVVVILGHSGCGAVSGAVDAYLRPLRFWSKSMSPMLRGLVQRIF